MTDRDLVFDQVGCVAVVATVPDKEGQRVIAVLDVSVPRAPRVVELTFTSRRMNRKQLREFMPDESHVRSAPALKAATIRGVALGPFEDAARVDVDDYQSMLRDVSQLLDWSKTHGYGIGLLKLDKAFRFRLDRDQAAAIRRVLAAWLYVHERGGTAYLAETLDITEGAARNLLQQARKAGYLSPGTPGKAGGEMTELGMDLLQAAIRAVHQYEEGLQ